MSTTKKQTGPRNAIRIEPGLPRKADKPAEGERPQAVEHRRAGDAGGLREKTAAAPGLRATRLASKPEADEAAMSRAEAAAGRPMHLPDLGSQIPRRAQSNEGAAPEHEQYVRLRIHVAGDRLEVVDSHLIDGPLGPPRPLTGTNAYEISIGDRLVYAGSLPDLGVQRSFVDPVGPARGLGHYETGRTVYDFNARIPARELTRETIGRVRVTLHWIKEPGQIHRLDQRRLAEQLPRSMRLVGELVGLPESVLPAAIEARGARTPRP